MFGYKAHPNRNILVLGQQKNFKVWKKGLKYVQNSDVIDIVLVSLLLNLNVFHIFF